MNIHLNALRADIEEYRGSSDRPLRSRPALIAGFCFLPRLQAVALLRLSQLLARHSPALATVVKWVNGVLTGSDISWDAEIGPGLQLFHPSSVVIGPRVTIGRNCRIMQGVTLGHGHGGSPRLGDDVFIGSNAVVVGAIDIGDHAHIGANSVVTFPVPLGARVRSQPARIVQ